MVSGANRGTAAELVSESAAKLCAALNISAMLNVKGTAQLNIRYFMDISLLLLFMITGRGQSDLSFLPVVPSDPEN